MLNGNGGQQNGGQKNPAPGLERLGVQALFRGRVVLVWRLVGDKGFMIEAPFRLVAFRNSEFLLGPCKNRGVDDGGGLEW